MRFDGTIDELCDLNVAGLVTWLEAIPVKEWHRLGDPSYENWDATFRPFAEEIVQRFYPGCKVGGMGLWLVEPGKVHPSHTDVQHDDWLVRIHIPLATNGGCVTTMSDGQHRLEVGKVYRFNTLSPHEVANNGDTRRIHFMFDVLR
jgi:hypothetical protein